MTDIKAQVADYTFFVTDSYKTAASEPFLLQIKNGTMRWVNEKIF